MPAENLNSYPVLTIRGRNYVDMTDPVDPVKVWTPAGNRQAPNIIGADKMPSKVTMSKDIAAIRHSMTPKAGRLSSGEWYQIRERLQRTNPGIEESMITGNYEATATLADFIHGKKVEKSGISYFDGLLLQHPETDGEILLTDEKGIIRTRDMWQMPLPLEGGFVKQLLQKNPDLGRFFDTIYGTENAGKQLPDYAYLSLPNNPAEILNLFRGGWGWHAPEGRRVYVGGGWRPSGSGGGVASRAAVSGRIAHRLDETVRSDVIRLLDQAKDASLNDAVQYVTEAQQKMPGVLSLMVEDI